MVRVLINVPKPVTRNVPFEVKVLMSHPMESGQRRDQLGLAIPRDIINHFVCALDRETVMEADFFPAIAANPFLAFSVIADKSGHLTFSFTDDHDVTQTETAWVEVA